MPREIIDTESSKPAYHRRLAIRWIVTIVVIVIVAFVAFEFWRSSHHAAAVGLTGLLRTDEGAPGNAARLSNQGLLLFGRLYVA